MLRDFLSAVGWRRKTVHPELLSFLQAVSAADSKAEIDEFDPEKLLITLTNRWVAFDGTTYVVTASGRSLMSRGVNAQH